VNDRKFSRRILWIVIAAVIAFSIAGGYEPITRHYIVFSSEGAVYGGSMDGKTIEKIFFETYGQKRLHLL